MEKYKIKSLVDKINYYTKLYDEGHLIILFDQSRVGRKN